MNLTRLAHVVSPDEPDTALSQARRYSSGALAADLDGHTMGGTEGVSALAQPLVGYERLRLPAHERPGLTVQTHAVVQYAGAAAEIVLAEHDGDTRPRLISRRVVQDAADDDRELFEAIAQVWELSMPADVWHEPSWEAACTFVEERWAQVAAVAEASGEAGELEGDAIRAFVGL